MAPAKRASKRRRTSSQNEPKEEENEDQQQQGEEEAATNDTTKAIDIAPLEKGPNEKSPVIVFAHGAGAPSSSDWMIRFPSPPLRL